MITTTSRKCPGPQLPYARYVSQQNGLTQTLTALLISSNEKKQQQQAKGPPNFTRLPPSDSMQASSVVRLVIGVDVGYAALHFRIMRAFSVGPKYHF